MQVSGMQVGTPPSPPGAHLPYWWMLVKSQTLPQAPQLLGSAASLAALTSSILPLQSLSMPSQISTPLLLTTQGPSPCMMIDMSGSNTRSDGGAVRSSMLLVRSPPVPPSSLSSVQLRQYGLTLQPVSDAV